MIKQQTWISYRISEDDDDHGTENICILSWFWSLDFLKMAYFN